MVSLHLHAPRKHRLTRLQNSNHVQLETYRQGLHGPYALVFSTGSSPSPTTDLSFWSAMNIRGYTPASGRGFVSGQASGIDGSKHPIVLRWSNPQAQYWTYASSSGSYTSPAMIPGTYTCTLYQDELKVGTSSVSVSAGSTSSHNIASTWNAGTNTIFQIGDWDGRPVGFRNADKQLRMHPSDARMSSWGPLTYTVESSATSDFPMAIWRGVNDPVTIHFSLASATTATLRIGTTLAFAGARPSVSVNGHQMPAQSPPAAINSRGVTRGAYRGWGDIYEFSLGSGVLVAGTNTVSFAISLFSLLSVDWNLFAGSVPREDHG